MFIDKHKFKLGLKSLLSNTMFWVALSSGSQVVALLYTVRSYEKTIQLNHYESLDRFYFDLRNMAYENPGMNDPERLSRVNKIKYDLYAEMTFNFLQTIFDRSKNDKELRSIWYSVVKVEYGIHKKWFDANYQFYPPYFVDFIRRFDNETLENIINSEGN